MSVVKIYGESLEPRKYDKVIFDGDETSARAFVEANYPRHHGHVPFPEVYVEHEAGNVEHYYGGEWTPAGQPPETTSVNQENQESDYA